MLCLHLCKLLYDVQLLLAVPLCPVRLYNPELQVTLLGAGLH